jgi:hypothetical protein
MCTGPTPFYLKGSYEGGDTPCYHGKQQDGWLHLRHMSHYTMGWHGGRKNRERN